MNKTIGWIVLVLAVVGIIWWASSKPAVVPVSGEPIKIGAIISQTGVAAAFGEMSKFGIDMAVEEINKKGGVDGRKVEVIFENDNTDPKVAAGLYQKLTSVDKVDAIIGSNFDFVTQPIFGLAATGDVVVISPSSPRIAGSFDTNPKSFVMMSDFSKIISELRPYLSTQPYKKLGIVHFASAFGAEIAKTLKTINQELGKPEMVDEVYNQIGNNDFRTIILKLKNAGVDLVLLDMAGPDPLTFVRQAKQLAYTPVMIADTAVKDSLAASGADRALFDGMVVINWDVTTDEFTEKFVAKYSREPGNSVNRAYDAVYILAKAIADANNLGEVSSVLETKSFSTPNGTFSFTADHAAENTPVSVQMVKSGQFVKL